MRTSSRTRSAAAALATCAILAVPEDRLRGQSPERPSAPPAAPTGGARFDTEGRLLPPADYRSFVFLTSGFDMSYGPAAVAAQAGGVGVLDNVFVDRAAYDGFLQTGVWPESTLFVLELRTAEETGSIVTRGRFQTDVVAIEAAVKDSTRFPDGGWGYFDFPLQDGAMQQAVKAFPKTASCTTCHSKHGAVEQTFTQFYPTLFEVAKAKGTVRKDFVGMPPDGLELERRLAESDAEAGRCAAVLAEVRTKWPQATVLRERSLNQLGYRLHAARRSAAAVAVLRAATESFPESANAWDSLAEVLEATGDRAGSRRATDRGLEALAKDQTMGDRLRARLDASLRDRKQRLQ